MPLSQLIWWARSRCRARPETITKPASVRPRGGGIARADDGDRWPLEHRQISAHGDERRRCIDIAKTRRIVWLAHRDETRTGACGGVEFALDVFDRSDLGRPPARHQPRQGRKRRASAAIAMKQCPERPQLDIFTVPQSQSIEALGVGQFVACRASTHALSPTAFGPPILDSVPAERRAILARCIYQSSNVRSA